MMDCHDSPLPPVVYVYDVVYMMSVVYMSVVYMMSVKFTLTKYALMHSHEVW